MVTDDLHPPSEPLRQAWQVPVFLLGLAALVGVLLGRPLWHSPEERHFEQQLTELRTAVSGSESDWHQALKLEQALVGSADRYPPRAGEVYFLLGTLYFRRADATSAGDSNEFLTAARQHLERAQVLGVAQEDAPALAYRLARCRQRTGAPAGEVIAVLAPAVSDRFEEAADAYRLLAQAYLELPVPDHERALAANRKLLALPTANEALLAPARLQQGEILARLGELSGSRAALLRIGPTAPHFVQARARELLAEVTQRLGAWTEAVELWQAALSETEYPPQNPARVRFELGRCYRQLDKVSEAEAVWNELLAAGGEEAQAAALELATLVMLRDSTRALAHYRRAFENVSRPEDYRNRLVDLASARDRLKADCGRLRDHGEFPGALQLADLVARLAESGEGALTRGQVEEAWAAALRASQPDAARAHANAAGAAYATAAAALPTVAGRAAALRQATAMYREAQNYSQAVVLLRNYLSGDSVTDPESAAAAHLELAQLYELLTDAAQAREAYLKCMEFPGRARYRAQFRLAQLEALAGKLEEAQQALARCLEVLREAHVEKEDQLYAEVLLGLADIYFRQTNYQQAAARYQEALEPAPDLPGVTRARFQLAECHRLLAEAERTNLTVTKVAKGPLKTTMETTAWERYQKHLRAALGQYRALASELVQRRNQQALPAEEETILRQADLSVARSLLSLGELPAAREHYELLATRYQGQAEQLVALSGVYSTHLGDTAPGARDRAAATLKELRSVLGSLDDKVFLAQPGGYTRAQWLDWVSGQLDYLTKSTQILQR